MGEPDSTIVVDLAFGAALVHPVPVNGDHVHARLRPVPQDRLHTRQVAQRECTVEHDHDVLGETDVPTAPAFGGPDGDQISELGDAAGPGVLGVANPAGHRARLTCGDVRQPGSPRQVAPISGCDQDDPQVVGAAEHAELNQQPPGQVSGGAGRTGDAQHTHGAQVDGQRHTAQGRLGETGPALAAQVDRGGLVRSAHPQPQAVRRVGIARPYPTVDSGRGKGEVEQVGCLHTADLLLGGHDGRDRVQSRRLLRREALIVSPSLSTGHQLVAEDAGRAEQTHHQQDGVTHHQEQDATDHHRQQSGDPDRAAGGGLAGGGRRQRHLGASDGGCRGEGPVEVEATVLAVCRRQRRAG